MILELQKAAQQEVKAAEAKKTEEVAIIGNGSAGLNTVVIPYKASMAQGPELMFALRAWEKNFPQLDQVIIIGDSPNFQTSELVKVIAITESSDNPQIDVALKMAAAIASPEVPDEFIWSNDDIYPTTQLTEADVKLLTAKGRLKEGKSDRQYNINRVNTIDALKEAGYDVFDYATHTPVVFEKVNLAKILEDFDCFKVGHLISSLYFNVHFDGVVPIIVHDGKEATYGNYIAVVSRSGVPIDLVKSEARRRKFLNNQDPGWPVVHQYLKKAFPQKSAFEA